VLSQRPGRILAELQPLHRDDETERVIGLLMSRASVRGVVA
jgi:hypothetical protein